MENQIKKSLLFAFTFLLIAVAGSFGQKPVNKYDVAWKKVQQFISKGLPQSALTEVKKIYTLAKAEQQDGQWIKALVHIASLQHENREDNEILSIADIEKEIAALPPAKKLIGAILNSLLADMYWNYFQDHRWQLYERTQTVNFRKTDLATWTPGDFHNRVSELYLLSIKDESLLQQTRLDAFDPIIYKGNMRHLRPTLFDLLANRAIEYFNNTERDVTRPAYAFVINDANALSQVEKFVSAKFITRDSTSLHHKALLIYQRLLAFHLRDANPSALIDADLARLQFVKAHAVLPAKDSLYLQTLKQITLKYGDLPAAAEAWYRIAEMYNTQADTYMPFGDTTHRYTRLKAKEILDRIIAQKDSSEGKIHALNLRYMIEKNQLQFSIEKVNIPQQPFRVWVSYKNFTRLHLRLVRVNEKLKEQLTNEYGDKYWPALLEAESIRNWQQTLPATNDMQQHSVEIKVDGLPAGNYVLIASNNNDFKSTKNVTGARLFYVSGISYVNNSADFFVLDRNTGRPLAKAAVQVWQQKYDYKQSKYLKEKTKVYTTDEKGYFRMEGMKRETNGYTNYSYLLDISHGNDRLFMNDLAYDNYYYNNGEPSTPKTTTSVFFFTDRSIYRPGQTLYFKGIVLSHNRMEKKGTTEADYTTTVILRDANYQDIDSIKVRTNEFGSFNGIFKLPSTGLNGQFSIYTKKDNGQSGFRVEEYKRPKFFVDFDPIKGTYKVLDNIQVTGFAKAYAGNNIDGASVKYRVVRQARFIYPWLTRRWWQPPVQEMEITNGETKTDKDGKFTITFQAIPDQTIDPKFEPVFDYKVYADVTDINGETRSDDKQVSVSYKSLLLVSDLPARLPTDSLKKIFIRSENMNGEFIPATLQVSITRLVEEKRLIRPRYWERPDQFVMSKEEYINYFPNDEYNNETDFRSWTKGATIYSRSDSSSSTGQWIINSEKFAPGQYIIEIEAVDAKGQKVKDVKYVELYDQSSRYLNLPAYLWTGIETSLAKPGKTALIEVGTSADNLFLIQQLEAEHQIPGGQPLIYKPGSRKYDFLELSNERRILQFPVTETDRGGFGANWMFVKHNRVFQHNQTITVPWDNKELKIEYITHRDKTLPGSEEKWKLRITGYNNEKIAAEMLATMYDASLDQFNPHGWSQPSIWPTYFAATAWSGSSNFVKNEAIIRYVDDEWVKDLDKRYDQLFNEEMNRIYNTGGYADGRGMKQMKAESVIVTRDAAANRSVAQESNQNEMDSSAVPPSPQNEEPKKNDATANAVTRKNFNETAFFFPDLRTDSTGAIEFSFTIPEALTTWKFMALAHTKEGAFGSTTKEIITQKELMVQPNAPRFLREGDKMEFTTKIVNLSSREMTGQAQLLLFDATTNQPVDGWFRNMMPNQYFTVAAGQSEVVKFPIEVPYQFDKALVWKVIARSGSYTDGEENIMPVLTNRMLVTETLTLPMRGSGTKNFTFPKLLQSDKSETLKTHALTLEYTSNPAWYAVQALPYLMEYPYDCAEQTWNRYYANALASYIANSSPKIKKVFELWKTRDTTALLSNLQKNAELKSLLLEETPWLVQGKTEAEQKKNIALLFDMVKMSEQLNSSYEKLQQLQSSNGGFVWFNGGPDDRYMTQYIVTGIGHLKKVKAVAGTQEEKLRVLLKNAIPYLDRKIREDYDYLIKNKIKLSQQNIGYIQIQYLYMRSFFGEYAIPSASKTAFEYYSSQAKQYWVKQSKFMQGMIALALNRNGDKKTPAAILQSLKETAIVNEELGMYWKDQRRGWFWYEAPIETHALMIETFQEVGNDAVTVDNLRTWLLKNKQTNNWKTTKATAEACYALLLQGTDWLTNEPVVEIRLGNNTVISSNNSQEAGTGYFKTVIEGSKVNNTMGNIAVTVTSPTPTGASWGSVYWQYFEDLDKITYAATPLSISKKLFVEENGDRGPVIKPVNEGSILKVGDKIKVRIELRVDRDMEYVHMKDMRASALEPVNVLSGYKYQGGLGYYETTKDASTNFFFNYLRKGTYVFEYTLFVTHAGNFSNGITTIQCMYAPEFTSHSEGVRISVE